MQRPRWLAGPLRLLIAAGLAMTALAACAEGQEKVSGEVDVLGIWGGEELAKFEAMVAPWQTDTGGRVSFTGTRDITAILTTRVEGANPPDIAIPAEVGLFREFARDGKLVPLSACGLEGRVKAEYPKPFLDLGSVDGALYGFFMKADTKGTIWYNPSFFKKHGYKPLDRDSKFQDLIRLANQILADKSAGVHRVAPWSMGVESGGASGWPGTDWIQQIILNEAGGKVYDGLIEGSVPFTDPRVKDAWQKLGQVAFTPGYVAQGGATGINATNFKDATYPPFESPPRAAMVYLGGFASGFIKDQFATAAAGEDYDFFPFPGGAVTGGANIAYAFNAKPATCSLLKWLASDEAQRLWVQRGGFTSVNKKVSLGAYPDPVARRQAEQLTKADLFRFDLDDAIGGALQQAFFQGVTQYLAKPGDLDRILAGIEAARK